MAEPDRSAPADDLGSWAQDPTGRLDIAPPNTAPLPVIDDAPTRPFDAPPAGSPRPPAPWQPPPLTEDRLHPPPPLGPRFERVPYPEGAPPVAYSGYEPPAPAGGPRPAGAELRAWRNLPAALIGFAGSALLIVGVLLPWQVVTLRGDRRSFRGWDITNDTRLLVALALVTVALSGFLLSARRGATALALKLGLGAVGALALGVAWVDLADASSNLRSVGLRSSVGAGVYVCLLGSLTVLAAAAAARFGAQRDSG